MNANVSMMMGVAALATVFGGCATGSHYVDAGDTAAAVLNENRMSSADWTLIVKKAGDELCASPLFDEWLRAYALDADDACKRLEAAGQKLSNRERISYHKPILMLSTIDLKVDEHLDANLLTDQLRQRLVNSGKVRFTTYAAGEGQSVDTATAQARLLALDPNVNQATAKKSGKVKAYDLSLAGSITKQTARSGRDREISYMFMLTLTDNETGEGVWTYTKEIKRQNTQGVFGF